MMLDRRSFGLMAAAAVAAQAMPRLALAQDEAALREAALREAMMAFTGGAEPTEGGVTIGAPEIAENGNTVPVDVAGDEGTMAIMILATGNPNPGVVTFRFSAMSAEPAATTRIRLAQTQDVIAVAERADGSFAIATREVKVTIGGCGG